MSHRTSLVSVQSAGSTSRRSSSATAPTANLTCTIIPESALASRKEQIIAQQQAEIKYLRARLAAEEQAAASGIADPANLDTFLLQVDDAPHFSSPAPQQHQQPASTLLPPQQPQLFDRPRFNAVAATSASFPQSHRHNQYALSPSPRISDFLMTVQRPCLPDKSFLFFWDINSDFRQPQLW